MKKYFSGCLLALVLCGCGHRKTPVEAAFYHWQSKYSTDPAQSQLLDSLRVKKLYIKYFDVDWDRVTDRALPEASVIINDNQYLPRQIIPVIFITNTVLANTKPAAIPALADSIYNKISRMDASEHIAPEEVQIDCDWSLSTRDRYFALLREIRAQMPSGALLSCTIRLHQVKYREKTGVPPVDRGVLMFYNMGRIEDEKEVNTIYDPATADKYLARLKDYPLSLDVALPIFSWGVVYESGKAKELLNGFSKKEMEGDKRFSPTDEDRYKVDSTCFIHGYYLRQDAVVRIEEITPYICRQAAAQLSAHLKNEKRTVIFFDLQPNNTNRYDVSDFEKTLEILR